MWETRRITLARFTRGWNPRNRPGTYLFPYDLLEGELADARGLEVRAGGSLSWRRNQLKIHSPHVDDVDANLGPVKSLVEYRTSTNNQLLAFCKHLTGPVGKCYVLATAWDALTTSSDVQWEYGGELFDAVVWAAVAVAPTLRWWGIADYAQMGDVLFITQWGATIHDAPFRWNGTNLKTIGLAKPTTDPTGAAATNAAYPLSTGTYSYYYTYTDGEFESFPSGIVDIVATQDNSRIELANLADHASDYSKKLYRAYTPDVGADARGAVFQYVATIADATTTYNDANMPYDLGEDPAYDCAAPPRISIVELHKDRLFGAGANGGSSSYSGYDSGYWGNILFWSAQADPYAWPGDNQLTVGDDTAITGLVSWGDLLLIFKHSSTWVLRGYDEGNFILEQLSPTVGCVAMNSAIGSPHGVLWAGTGAFYFYDGSTITRLLTMDENESPWQQWSASSTVRTVSYHNDRFYVLQNGYLLMYAPETNRWTYFAGKFVDSDGYQSGLHAFNFSSKQAHLLVRMVWEDVVFPAGGGTGDHDYITVLHPSFEFELRDDPGSELVSSYYAPVKVTLGPIMAPPGMTIQPRAVWVRGSWDVTVGEGVLEEPITASYLPDIYVNRVGDYSHNAWTATPDCPQGGNVIGVPAGWWTAAVGETPGFWTSNIGPEWYVQISAIMAPNFELNAVEVEYYVMPARGE